MNRTAWIPISVLLCLISLGSTGCICWPGKDGTHHVLVIGVGIVSVNNSKSTAASVTRAQMVGLSAGADGVVAGYSSRFSTAVPAGAEDVRIEASQHPFTPIKIEVQKAQLTKTNQTGLDKETK